MSAFAGLQPSGGRRGGCRRVACLPVVAISINYSWTSKSPGRGTMQEPPKGWPRMVSSIFYDDAAAAIDWLVRAFGFEVQLKIEGEGGRIEYSQLVYGGGQVTIGQADPSRPGRAFAASPRSAGGHNTQAVCVCVDDADAMCARARAAGVVISVEPTTIDYG